MDGKKLEMSWGTALYLWEKYGHVLYKGYIHFWAYSLCVQRILKDKHSGERNKKNNRRMWHKAVAYCISKNAWPIIPVFLLPHLTLIQHLPNHHQEGYAVNQKAEPKYKTLMRGLFDMIKIIFTKLLNIWFKMGTEFILKNFFVYQQCIMYCCFSYPWFKLIGVF